MKQIRLALENNIDVSLFAKEDYNEHQMLVISLGLKHNLDVSHYLNPNFNWLQMDEIRKGLVDNLDVSLYANINNNWDEMSKIREELSKANKLTIKENNVIIEIRRQKGDFNEKENCNSFFIRFNNYKQCLCD